MKAQLQKVEEGYAISVRNGYGLEENEIPYFLCIYYYNVVATNFKPNFTTISIVSKGKIRTQKELLFTEILDALIDKTNGNVSFTYFEGIAFIDFENPNREFTKKELTKLISKELEKMLWIKHPTLMIERSIIDFLDKINYPKLLRYVIYCLIGLAVIQILS